LLFSVLPEGRGKAFSTFPGAARLNPWRKKMENLSTLDRRAGLSPELANMGVQVLVVEDEAIIAMDILSMLKKMGCAESEAVFSGEESVKKVAEHRPDLVLMDIRLKGRMDGIQAAQQILHKYDVPVVYLTALGDSATIDRANGSARFGYLTKPFEENELRSTIRNVLDQAYC
jgi:CheY-like chemotaxis protein